MAGGTISIKPRGRWRNDVFVVACGPDAAQGASVDAALRELQRVRHDRIRREVASAHFDRVRNVAADVTKR